jgi:spermidine synthase
MEDLGHLPLLFHPQPKKILIISAGAGGLINEILKHDIENIDYLEIDPLVISMLKNYPTKLTASELGDSRVNIINLDGRLFLRTHPKLYDLVLIGLSNQSDLSTNRLFTQEFFSLVKARLNPNGILAFWVPGSSTYLSEELKDINASILNAAKKNFNYLRIIPGDYNIYLASSAQDIMSVSASLISKRISEQNIQTSILVPRYIDYRLSKYWLDWFTGALAGSTREINQDLRPIAVFETLKLWNNKFSPNVTKILSLFKGLNLNRVSVFVILLSILVFFISKYQCKKNVVIAYSIATTGFFGMLSNLILIFSFQVFYGYLYQWIGLLISIFMTGIAGGSIFMVNKIPKLKKELRFFMGLELSIIVFSLIMASIVLLLTQHMQNVTLIFVALFLISGVLLGLEFPLASKIYLGSHEGVGETVGVLYGADLIGGWVAGICGGIVLLPVLGLFNTCIVALLFKLSSLSLIILIPRRNPRALA